MIETVILDSALVEVSRGVGDTWSHYRVVGATRAGLAAAKESVGKAPERYKLVDPQTIFYNPMRILLGSIAMIDDSQEPGITSPDYVVFKTREGILHHRWFYYWLRSPMGADFIRTLARGAVRERMLFRRLAAAEIDIPPWESQCRMAEQFTHISYAAEHIEAQIEAAQALPAAYLRAVFESEDAQEWPLIPIGEVTRTCSGATPSRTSNDYYAGGTIPWVKTGELRDAVIMDTEEHITDTALRDTSLTLLPPGTVLVAMYGQGQTRGRTGILACTATTNQACLAILPNRDRFVPEYLQYWFQHNYYALRAESDGRGGNQPNLNGDMIRAQNVQWPSIAEQSRIAALLKAQMSAVTALRHRLEEQTAAVTAITQALLRQAFAGEF